MMLTCIQYPAPCPFASSGCPILSQVMEACAYFGIGEEEDVYIQVLKAVAEYNLPPCKAVAEYKLCCPLPPGWLESTDNAGNKQYRDVGWADALQYAAGCCSIDWAWRAESERLGRRQQDRSFHQSKCRVFVGPRRPPGERSLVGHVVLAPFLLVPICDCICGCACTAFPETQQWASSSMSTLWTLTSESSGIGGGKSCSACAPAKPCAWHEKMITA
eukprot:1157333-Pelagomonas_calceolata.AAC.2